MWILNQWEAREWLGLSADDPLPDPQTLRDFHGIMLSVVIPKER